jgi:hypothetical protein
MNLVSRIIFAALLWAIVAPVMPSALVAQQGGDGDGRPVATVTPMTAPAPVIDGRLDDEAWTLGEPITEFFQREPVEGEPVSERTEVRILADAEALYVGAWLYDRRADEIVTGSRTCVRAGRPRLTLGTDSSGSGSPGSTTAPGRPFWFPTYSTDRRLGGITTVKRFHGTTKGSTRACCEIASTAVYTTRYPGKSTIQLKSKMAIC